MDVSEDKGYKHNDYGFRASDPYAFRKYRIIMSWLPKADNLRILNAGCGSGEMNWLLATQNPTWQIDAIDIDQQAVELSREIKEKYQLENLHLFETSIEDHSASTPYDIVVSNDVLEHIDDVVYAIACLHKLSKSDAQLFLSVPALQWLFGYHDRSLGHYRRYNRHMMREQLEGYFQVDRMRYFGALLIPIALWFSRIRNQPYPLKSQEDKQSLAARIVNLVLSFEERISLGTGTSLLVKAQRIETSNGSDTRIGTS